MNYDQARKDHEYLWETYGPARDMTGGYVDQNDLSKLLKKPTKATALDCYQNQITYWFQSGFDADYRAPIDQETSNDPMVQEIAERHFLEEYLNRSE